MIQKLYYILLYCICFEETLAYMEIPVTSIKYVVVAFLVYLLKRKGAKFTFSCNETGLKFFISLLVIALIRAIPVALGSDFDGIIYWKNFLWFPLLIYIFSNMEVYTNITYERYIKHYINAMCLYVIVDILLYFIPVPFLIANPQRYWGRLTVGYPTIDVILICSALGFLFFNRNRWSIKEILIRSIILFIGVCIQASGTSIILCLIVLGLLVLYICNVGIKYVDTSDIRRSFLMFLMLLFVGGSTVLTAFKNNNPTLYESMYLQLENRFYILIGQEEEAELEVNTMQQRDDHLQRATKRFLNDDVSKLIGVGFGNVSVSKFDKNHIFAEDQSTFNKITIGLLGNAVYFVVLFGMFTLVWFFFNKTPIFYVFILTWLFLLMSSFTSGNILSFGPIGLWTLVYSYAKTEKIKY